MANAGETGFIKPGACEDSPSSAGRSPIWRTFLLAGAVGVLGGAGFLPTLNVGLLPDDDRYVTENRLLHDWAGLKRIWSDPNAMEQYYPLTFTSFWVEHQLWGSDLKGYHAVNILIHALNAVLVYILMRGLRLPGAFLIAALFGLHPANVSSVAWVAERKNVLSTAFCLGSLLCCARFLNLDRSDERPGGSWVYCVSGLILFCCALLSKTVTATLPVAILVMMWWRRRKPDARAALALVPMFGFAAALGTVTIRAERELSGAADKMFEFSLVERVLIAGRAVWHYAATLLAPFNLCMAYPRWNIDTGAWWWYLFPLLAVCVLVFAWFLRGRIGRGVFTGCVLFVVTLGPALGLVSFSYMQHSFVADHLVYLPSIPMLALCISVATFLARRWTRVSSKIPSVAAGVLICGLALMTWNRSTIYADEEKLWNETIAKNPNSFMAWNSLGIYHRSKGDLDRAISDYTKAIELNPDPFSEYHNRANAYFQKHQYDQAIADYDKAVELAPDNVKTYAVRSYLGRAAVLEATGNLDKAVADYTEALRLDPHDPSPYVARARAHIRKGQYAEVILDCTAAIELNPGDHSAHCLRSLALQMTGELDRAMRDLERAIELDPTKPTYYINRGALHTERRDHVSAVRDFTKAIDLDPGKAAVYYNRARVHHQAGQYDLAISDYSSAIERAPGAFAPYVLKSYLHRAEAYEKKGDVSKALADRTAAHVLTGEILTRAGRYAELIGHWRSVLRLRDDSVVALNTLAWILATNEDVRYSSPAVLDTLAAAYAEAGRFDDAVRTMEKACELIGEGGPAEELRARLDLYRAGRPYRESGSSADWASSGRKEQ